MAEVIVVVVVWEENQLWCTSKPVTVPPLKELLFPLFSFDQPPWVATFKQLLKQMKRISSLPGAWAQGAVCKAAAWRPSLVWVHTWVYSKTASLSNRDLQTVKPNSSVDTSRRVLEKMRASWWSPETMVARRRRGTTRILFQKWPKELVSMLPPGDPRSLSDSGERDVAVETCRLTLASFHTLRFN